MLKTKQMKTLLAASLFAPVAAFATNGILPYGNGMSAHGVGGAGIANPADAMSGVDNPALIADTAGQASLGASLFNPNRSMDYGLGRGYVESESNYFVIPQAAWVGQGEALNWGVLAYAMGGMNTDYPQNAFYGPGTFGPGTPGSPRSGMDLSGLIVSPTASYRLSPNLSLGASLLLGYARLETEGLATGNPASSSETDSATGWGVKLGVASEVVKGVRLGATYQPKMNMSKMDAYCNTIFSGTDCELSLPPIFGIGGAFALGDSVNLVADVQRIQWSKVEIFKDVFEWEDQTVFKVGTELKSGSDLIYRVGLNYGKSPIPNSAVVQNVLAPAVTETHLSVGFTKKFSGFDLVGYYAYVFGNEQTGPGPAPGTTAKVKMDQNALGIGGNWKF